MGDLSLNFNRSEFRCRHCGRVVGPTPALVTMLQRARTMAGRSLNLVNAYRCPERNRQVGGAPNSAHLVGNAADVPGGYLTVKQWQACGAHRIGTRGGRVIHVDMWPGVHEVFVD